MNTKERILYEALELFSNKGFEAVSMRDIAGVVGIRESSIYKHYSGKQAILDAIVERAMEEMEQMLRELDVPMPNVESSVSRYAEMKIEEVADLCSSTLLMQRENEIITKFRRLLTMEQYRNEELRKLFIDVFIERQISYNEKVFDYLLKAGVLWGESARHMALQFYAPFFLLQYRLPDDEEQLETALKEHILCFLREHMKGDLK